MATKINIKTPPLYLWDVRIIIALIMLIASLLSFLLYVNFTVDFKDTLYNAQKEELTLKSELSNKTELAHSADLYIAKDIELDRLESVIMKRFPNGEEIPNIIVNVNQMSEEVGVTISNMVPSTDDKLFLDPNIKIPADIKLWTKKINIVAKGSPKALADFAYAIAKYPPVLQIQDVKMSRIDDDNVDVVITMNVFYVK